MNNLNLNYSELLDLIILTENNIEKIENNQTLKNCLVHTLPRQKGILKKLIEAKKA